MRCTCHSSGRRLDTPASAIVLMVGPDCTGHSISAITLGPALLPTRAWCAQLTDISQWGSAEEAARLLLPRGARLLAASAAVVSQPPRDTGTLVGVVEQAPRTMYRRGPPACTAPCCGHAEPLQCPLPAGGQRRDRPAAPCIPDMLEHVV